MDLQYHTQIYGVTQSGKTYLGLKLLTEQRGINLFIDTKSELKYNKYFHGRLDLKNIPVVLQNPKMFENKNIALDIDIEEELPKQLDSFAKVVFLHQREDPFYRVTILIDELQEYITNRSVKKFIRALFIQGLSKNIRVIFTCQGWSMIAKNLRNNCENTIILKQREQDIRDMMDLGLVPYEVDERGWKHSLLNFERQYQAYMEVGIGGEFGELQ